MLVVFLLLGLIAADAKHHGHHNRENKHHKSIMSSTKTFLSCADGGDFDACLTAHVTSMDKWIAGARTPFDSENLPSDVANFTGCFETLKSCVNDGGGNQKCTDAMLTCVGQPLPSEKEEKKFCTAMLSVSSNKMRMMMKKKGKNHAYPMPIQIAIQEYVMCKCRAAEHASDDLTHEVCTQKKIVEVTKIMNWAKLARCQMKAVLCQYDAEAKVDCLVELKSCMGDTTPKVPKNAPQKMATMFTKMDLAKGCFADNTAAGCTVDTCSTDKYLSCVMNDSTWIKDEGRHVYCFGKLKTCAVKKGKADEDCRTEYSTCLGTHASH